MLLVYCQFIVYLIFFFSFISYMKRFFVRTDHVSAVQQRRLPRSQGGRLHPLLRRSFRQYMYAFDFAFHMMSATRLTHVAENRYIRNYNDNVGSGRNRD